MHVQILLYEIGNTPAGCCHTHTCGCYVLIHNVLSVVLVLQMLLADDLMVAYARYDSNLHIFVTNVWFVLYVPL